MATYLLRSVDREELWKIIEANSARQAIADFPWKDNETVDVWTLRSQEPRTYEVTTESVRTITQT